MLFLQPTNLKQPDGKYIAFIRLKDKPDGGIWAINAADGSNPQQINSCSMAHTYKVDLDWAYTGGEKIAPTTSVVPTPTPTIYPTSKTTPPVVPTPTLTPKQATTTTKNTITFFKLQLIKLGQGEKPNTTSYIIAALIDAKVDRNGASVSIVDSVNSVPVTAMMHYPEESLSLTLHREDLSPGQIITAKCVISPDGNEMSASITVP